QTVTFDGVLAAWAGLVTTANESAVVNATTVLIRATYRSPRWRLQLSDCSHTVGHRSMKLAVSHSASKTVSASEPNPRPTAPESESQGAGAHPVSGHVSWVTCSTYRRLQEFGNHGVGGFLAPCGWEGTLMAHECTDDDCSTCGQALDALLAQVDGY